MRIVTRPSAWPPTPRRRRPPARASRSHGRGPRGVLLSPGGRADPLVPSPARALALDALAVLRDLHQAQRRSEAWTEPRFARQVEVVRAQLGPIVSREALADSFRREAFQSADHEPDEGIRVTPGPVRVAYAVRWLELGDGQARPPWATWLTVAEWEAPEVASTG